MKTSLLRNTNAIYKLICFTYLTITALVIHIEFSLYLLRTIEYNEI